MHVVIAGASGLIGEALVARLRSEGWRVTRLVRSRTDAADERTWYPRGGVLDSEALADADAVVHLGGATIAGVWTPSRKKAIRDSRIRTTRLLAERIAEIPRPPAVFVHASGTGYYGDRGDERLTESSEPGDGFLANLCRDWEAASDPAEEAGVRVVRVRTAPVLAARGGLLAPMLPLFRMGLGARFGSGRQWMPWIALEDIAAVYALALAHATLAGPVNAVAPEEVTNAGFTRALARAAGRPALLRAPAFALRMLPGGMGQETMLVSQRVAPDVLATKGFSFRFATLTPALDHCLHPDRSRA